MVCSCAFSPSRNSRGYAGSAFLPNSTNSADSHSEDQQCFAHLHFPPSKLGEVPARSFMQNPIDSAEFNSEN